MDDKSLLTVIKSILAQPTAPFHEYYVRAAIIELLDNQPDIRLEIDPFGNLLAYYRGCDSPPRWTFGSHMDHPGWVKALTGENSEPPKTSACKQRNGFTFLGGVPDRYFESETAITEFGDFAMWDLQGFRRENGRISSRACDDLIGCAAIVCTLLDLQKNKVPTSCVGMFTRAEEVGFVGAIELAKTWPLDEDAVFVSIETSVPTDTTRIGNGPICRVGDRLSIFDSNATAAMLEVSKMHEIPVQRALLDRGSCEATALQAYGIKTAGVSVPLGNYHNCGEHNRIRAEYVDQNDVKNLVRLLVALTSEFPSGPPDSRTAVRERIEARADQYTPYVKASAKKFA